MTKEENFEKYIGGLTTTTTDGLTADDIAEFRQTIKNAFNLQQVAIKTAMILISQPIPCFYVDSSQCKNCDRFFCAYNLGRKLEQVILNGKESKNEN